MIVLPSEAKTSGLTWYFTGKPCKHGQQVLTATENVAKGNRWSI